MGNSYASQPTVNWWHGNLRPFESPLSFATRFCLLNSISLTDFEKFFEYQLGAENSLTIQDIAHISSLIKEDISLLETVFDQKFRALGSNYYPLPFIKRVPEEVRYCPLCAKSGYHSHIHELPWLDKCPYHLIKLESIYSPFSTSSVLKVKRMEVLASMISNSCHDWPYYSNEKKCHIDYATNNNVQLLRDWTTGASASAFKVEHDQIWHSDEHAPFHENSYGHLIGRLRKLRRMPTQIVPLFGAIGEDWNLDFRRFPRKISDELNRVERFIRFSRLFDAYKIIGAHATTEPAFIKKRNDVKDSLAKRHGKCQCRWGRAKVPWGHQWEKVDPNGWPYSGCKCPYEVAIEELYVRSGLPESALSSRKAYELLTHDVQLLQVIKDAGLLNYGSDAKVSPYGFLYVNQDVWSVCEWNRDSPLTELFETLAQDELESFLIEKCAWLDAIDDGVPPYEPYRAFGWLRLCRVGTEVRLIRWRPRRGT